VGRSWAKSKVKILEFEKLFLQVLVAFRDDDVSKSASQVVFTNHVSLDRPVTARNRLVDDHKQSGHTWRDSGEHGEMATRAGRASNLTRIYCKEEPKHSYEESQRKNTPRGA